MEDIGSPTLASLLEGAQLAPLSEGPEGATQAPVTPVHEGAQNTSVTSPATPNTSTVLKSTREDDELASFVDLDTLGLRRTKRDIKLTVKLKESRITDPRNKSLVFHNPMVMLIITLTAFNTAITAMAMTLCAQCYQSRAIEYNDFVETNFDGSADQLNLLAQIYMTT